MQVKYFCIMLYIYQSVLGVLYPNTALCMFVSDYALDFATCFRSYYSLQAEHLFMLRLKMAAIAETRNKVKHRV
jgi:hypothetical protein